MLDRVSCNNNNNNIAIFSVSTFSPKPHSLSRAVDFTKESAKAEVGAQCLFVCLFICLSVFRRIKDKTENCQADFHEP